MSSKTSLAIAIAIAPATTSTRIWTPQGFRAQTWRTIRDDEPCPTAGAILVSLSRWRATRHDHIANAALTLGLAVTAADQLDHAPDDLHHLRLIELPFPKFTDGRAYSMARRLRELWGYGGELRASGDVLFDQLPLMLRCGFDSFSISDAATLAAIERAPMPAPGRMYQSTAYQAHTGHPRQTTTTRALAAAR